MSNPAPRGPSFRVLLQYTCLDVSNDPQDLESLVQVCFIRAGSKVCRTVAHRNRTGHPCVGVSGVISFLQLKQYHGTSNAKVMG